MNKIKAKQVLDIKIEPSQGPKKYISYDESTLEVTRP